MTLRNVVSKGDVIMRRLTLLALLFLTATAAARAANNAETTRTGWFSDEGCATGRVKSGAIGPTNRDCAQKCIAKGAKMVFIDEKARALFFVDNPDAAKGQEGHYVQVVATPAADSRTLHVRSVKVLEEYKASCSR
jgi:hypothetical protein